MICLAAAVAASYQTAGLVTSRRGAVSMVEGSTSTQRRASLAHAFIKNEGFYGRPRPELMADDFVFMGPIVGPLNKLDYLGTVGTFKVYDAFPDVQVDVAPFTQDPGEPDRYWSVIRVSGTHTGELDLGSASIPATGKTMVVGPQAVSVTFDASDKVSRLTGGYIADARDGASGREGAMFAVMKAVGVPTPNPHGRCEAGSRAPGFLAVLLACALLTRETDGGRRLVKLLNWLGAKRKDYPKARSHVDDLPGAWQAWGRKHGRRTADAWS